MESQLYRMIWKTLANDVRLWAVDSMLEFNAQDVFYIKGLGFAFAGRNPEATTREGLQQRYVGKQVKINGKGGGDLFTVVGVESTAIEHQREGAGISLLVKPK